MGKLEALVHPEDVAHVREQTADLLAGRLAFYHVEHRVRTVTGIPDEFRGRIFEKFAQADGSDTRKKGGTGLGFSICRAIVERSGGTIGYESESGKGTVFYFELPLRA